MGVLLVPMDSEVSAREIAVTGFIGKGKVMEQLKNKVVLITGGTSGIGEASVLTFVREGALVYFTGRRQDKAARVIQKAAGFGGEARYITCDHTDPAQNRRAIELVVEETGRLDILFNNAGIVTKGTADSTEQEAWDLTLLINVTAVWQLCKYAIPVMRQNKGGVIINNASDWGIVGAPNALPYAASKGAIVQMTRSMAIDHAPDNIRVNAVCPGDTFVDRWLEKGYFEGEDPVTVAEAMQGSVDSNLMRRFAAPQEIANAALFLASDQSSFMTGQLLVVDGGNTAR